MSRDFYMIHDKLTEILIKVSVMNKNRTHTSVFRRLLRRLKTVNSKPLLITVSAALSIGLVFGFFMLQMVHKEQQESTYHVYATTDQDQEEQKNTSVETPELNIYVHQGGVFEEKENAEEYSELLEKNDVPFLIKQEEGQYLVWMNVQQSESAAKKQVQKMDKQGIDVYVKEWHIPAATMKIEEQTAKWIESLSKVVQEAVETETIDSDELTKLGENDSVPEQVQIWQEQLEQQVIDGTSDEQKTLELIALYERILKDIKE